MVPRSRIRDANQAPLRPVGEFVLYWMIATRRTRWNFALEKAVEEAKRLGKPLVILEALRIDYPGASDRLHRFVLDGMAENARALRTKSVAYYPYVEPEPGAGKGLLEALAGRAALVVTDDFPAFRLPRMVAAAATRLPVRLLAVDSNGLLPMRAAGRTFPTAFAFRRYVQAGLAAHLQESPREDPFRGAALAGPPALPREVTRRWPPAPAPLLAGEGVERLPIDHRVPAAPVRGGSREARALLDRFLSERLAHYHEQRNHPDRDATSGLSPYLHFGHVSAHEILAGIAKQESWSPEKTARRHDGKREGWWNLSPSAEGFLDQLVTWRELGYNFCAHRDDYDDYASLPPWALDTLTRHGGDRRERLYTLDTLETARTHDPLWNAAQTQLVREGRIHNYLRMLWGKKILEWTPSHREALAVMIALNDRYALDGRDPNSYSGIFWILGRYDRPWGPERPVFGTVRYMSSDNTRRKLQVKEYLARYDPDRPAETALPGARKPRRRSRGG